jgi:hypothetical protein
VPVGSPPRASSTVRDNHVAGGNSTHAPSMHAARGSGLHGVARSQPCEENRGHTSRFTKSEAALTICKPVVDTMCEGQGVVQSLPPNPITQSSSVLQDQSATNAKASRISFCAAAERSLHVDPLGARLSHPIAT